MTTTQQQVSLADHLDTLKTFCGQLEAAEHARAELDGLKKVAASECAAIEELSAKEAQGLRGIAGLPAELLDRHSVASHWIKDSAALVEDFKKDTAACQAARVWADQQVPRTASLEAIAAKRNQVTGLSASLISRVERVKAIVAEIVGQTTKEAR